MKKLLILPVLFLSFLLLTGFSSGVLKVNADDSGEENTEESQDNNSGGDTKTFNEKGLKITVSKSEDTIKGFSTFTVSVVNSNSKQKTLNAKIVLDGGDAGEGTVYIEVPGKKSKEIKKEVKKNSEWSSWDLKIVKIYDF